MVNPTYQRGEVKCFPLFRLQSYGFVISMKNLLIICAALITSQAWGQTDPWANWKTIETTHFKIIHKTGDEKVAQTFADEAEWSVQVLQPVLKSPIPVKVPVVVADVTDSSNGAATFLPRSQIFVYPILPTTTSSLTEYDNWVKELMLHEYTHVVNFEPTSGVMGVLRTIMGGIVRPAGLLPRWYMEGLAVEVESRYTKGGRGRSNYYQALIRSDIESSQWGSEKIGRLASTSIPTWPRGARPYTYGYFLMNYLAEESPQGPEVFSTLNHRYGGRFPWIINGPAKDNFEGRKWQELLDDMYDKRSPGSLAQLQTIKSQKTTQGQSVEEEPTYSWGPQMSPDGLKLVFISSPTDSFPQISLLTRKNTREKFSKPEEDSVNSISAIGLEQIAWDSDSKTVYYTKQGVYKFYYQFNDLYKIDIMNPDAEEERLTYGLRAREVAVLKNGKLAVTIGNANNTQLILLNKDGKGKRVLVDPAFGHRVSNPRGYKDGIIYSRKGKNKTEWIEYLSLKSYQTRKLTNPKPGIMHIHPQPDLASKSGFYFAASDSGVVNIYRHDGNRTYVPITNVTTQAMTPLVDHHQKDLYFSRLSKDGFVVEKTSALQRPAFVPKVKSTQSYPPLKNTAAPAATVVSRDEYNSFEYLAPQYVFPFVWIVPDGALFTASTGSSDPLTFQGYGAQGAFDTRNGLFSGGATYFNTRFGPLISASYIRANQYVLGSGSSFLQEQGILRAQISPSGFTNQWALEGNYRYQMFDGFNILQSEHGPGVMVSYSDVLPSRGYQISPTSGKYFSIGNNFLFTNWGSRFNPSLDLRAGIYWSDLLPKRHAIYLNTDVYLSPKQPTVILGTKVGGGQFPLMSGLDRFLARGYAPGEFLGYRMIATNLEYRFPIKPLFKGLGTAPMFFKKLSGAIVADALTLDGGFFDSRTDGGLTATKLGRFFMDAGAEVKVSGTLFYGFPAEVKLGAYWGFTEEAYGGFTWLLGLGLADVPL